MDQQTVNYLTPLVGELVDVSWRNGHTVSGILGINQMAYNVEPGCGGFGVHYIQGTETRFLLVFPGATLTCEGREYILR